MRKLLGALNALATCRHDRAPHLPVAPDQNGQPRGTCIGCGALFVVEIAGVTTWTRAPLVDAVTYRIERLERGEVVTRPAFILGERAREAGKTCRALAAFMRTSDEKHEFVASFLELAAATLHRLAPAFDKVGIANAESEK